jgi:hypothetical protein
MAPRASFWKRVRYSLRNRHHWWQCHGNPEFAAVDWFIRICFAARKRKYWRRRLEEHRREAPFWQIQREDRFP